MRPDGVTRLVCCLQRLEKVECLALGIDGGKTSMADHSKLVTITAISPELEHDALLHTHVMLLGHENSMIQASVLDEVCAKYNLPPKKVSWLVADGASVNSATVDTLKRDWSVKGWGRLRYARCMPHALNIPLTKYLTAFDAEYAIGSHLREARAIMTAGGSNSALIVAIEYALTKSGFDYADTRWSSLVRAIQYMMADQTAAEMKKANIMLLARAKHEGDADAAAAAQDASAPCSHWAAMGMCLDDLLVNSPAGRAAAAGDEDGSSNRVGHISLVEKALAYNCNIDNFAAFCFLDQLLSGVPALFKPIQGEGDWAATFQQPGQEGLKTAEDAMAELSTALTSISIDANAAPLLEECRRKMKQQQELVLTNAKLVGETIVAGKDEYDEADVPAVRAANNALCDAAIVRLKKAIKSASTAVGKGPGLSKLAEALKELKVKRRFLFHDVPEELPAENPAMFDFLGVHDDDRKFAYATKIRTQLATHKEKFKMPDIEVTPSMAVTYWKSLRSTAPELSALALVQLARPMSSASNERVFSIATDMDDPKTSRTQAATLTNTLFLRANRSVSTYLLDRHATLRLPTDATAGIKRTALEAGVVSASAALNAAAAGLAASAATGPAGKRARTEGDKAGDAAAAGISGGAGASTKDLDAGIFADEDDY